MTTIKTRSSFVYWVIIARRYGNSASHPISYIRAHFLTPFCSSPVLLFLPRRTGTSNSPMPINDGTSLGPSLYVPPFPGASPIERRVELSPPLRILQKWSRPSHCLFLVYSTAKSREKFCNSSAAHKSTALFSVRSLRLAPFGPGMARNSGTTNSHGLLLVGAVVAVASVPPSPTYAEMFDSLGSSPSLGPYMRCLPIPLRASCIKFATWRKIGGVGHYSAPFPELLPRVHVPEKKYLRAKFCNVPFSFFRSPCFRALRSHHSIFFYV